MVYRHSLLQYSLNKDKGSLISQIKVLFEDAAKYFNLLVQYSTSIADLQEQDGKSTTKGTKQTGVKATKLLKSISKNEQKEQLELQINTKTISMQTLCSLRQTEGTRSTCSPEFASMTNLNLSCGSR